MEKKFQLEKHGIDVRESGSFPNQKKFNQLQKFFLDHETEISRHIFQKFL
jgi:hypothetical protein